MDKVTTIRKQTEADIQAEIVSYLEDRGIFVAATDSSLQFNRCTGTVSRGKISVRGFPDLTLVLDGRFDPQGVGGRSCFLEVKSPTGRLRDSQRETIDRLRSAGALVEVVRSVEEVEQLLDDLETRAKEGNRLAA
jgi:hypothetical protein